MGSNSGPRHFLTVVWKIMEVKKLCSLSWGSILEVEGETLFLMWFGDGSLFNCVIHKFETLVDFISNSSPYYTSVLKLECNFLLIVIHFLMGPLQLAIFYDSIIFLCSLSQRFTFPSLKSVKLIRRCRLCWRIRKYQCSLKVVPIFLEICVYSLTC